MNDLLNKIQISGSKDDPKPFVCLEADDNGGKEDFVVYLTPRDPDEVTKLLRKHMKKGKWNRSTGRREEKLDEAGFDHEFNRRYIKDWTGLTVDGLRHLIAFTVKEGQSLDLDRKVDFDYETVDLLMKHSVVFSNFVTETVRDVTAFTDDIEKQLSENFSHTSKQTPKGSSRKVNSKGTSNEE